MEVFNTLLLSNNILFIFNRVQSKFQDSVHCGNLGGCVDGSRTVRCGNLGGCVDRSRTVYVVVIWVAVLMVPGQCTLW